MNARDNGFFLRYHSDKATELREGIMHVLRGERISITREDLLGKLPEGAHTYVVSEQPKVLDVILGNLEADGLIRAARKGSNVLYCRNTEYVGVEGTSAAGTK
jgi:hypothetical protein